MNFHTSDLLLCYICTITKHSTPANNNMESGHMQSRKGLSHLHTHAHTHAVFDRINNLLWLIFATAVRKVLGFKSVVWLHLISVDSDFDFIYALAALHQHPLKKKQVWRDLTLHRVGPHAPHAPGGSFRKKKKKNSRSQWMGFVLDGIIRCESPLGTRLMKLKQLGDQIRICSADI